MHNIYASITYYRCTNPNCTDGSTGARYKVPDYSPDVDKTCPKCSKGTLSDGPLDYQLRRARNHTSTHLIKTARQSVQQALHIIEAKSKKVKYKQMSKKKKDLASENIREHHHHLGRHPGAHEQAIAIGLAQAVKNEKES